MKIVVQRSKKASVTVDEQIVGKIDFGLTVLVGFTHSDTVDNVNKMIKKILKLRIFDDENGVMNKNVLEVNGEILSISQFTLYADTKKGNRPSYIFAMNGDKAKVLYDYFNEELKKFVNVETGIFGADMLVALENDGPITITIEN